ncbi:hypothetical protein OAU50_04730 [Planctomycetota bacterium]|nr:hypothetical protein [Planctomycetota bacterium]
MTQLPTIETTNGFDQRGSFTAKANHADPILTNLRSALLHVGQPLLDLKQESRRYVHRSYTLEDGTTIVLGWRRRSKRVELAIEIVDGLPKPLRRCTATLALEEAFERLEARTLNMTVDELRDRREELGLL